MAKNRIAELKEQQHAKEIEDLKSRQLSMKLEIEQAHLEEFNNFNKEWDEKMRSFEEKSKEDEEKLSTSHSEEIENTKKQILSKIPDKPKASSEILNLQKILKNLAKQKK